MGKHYSYSQLTTFEECPYAYYMSYIEKVPQAENAFAQYGTLVHSLLDGWAKGNIKKEDLADEFSTRYALEVTENYPAMLAAKGYDDRAYDQGVEYFETFKGFPGFKIVDTERKFRTDIDGREFVGIIDMVLEDEFTGETIILDHKSKSLNSFRKSEDKMYRQQYLYAKSVYELTGKWPDRLMFNLFKEGGLLLERKFDLATYEETLAWAADTMKQIEETDIFSWFETKEKPDFYCRYLCGPRGECPVSKLNFAGK